MENTNENTTTNTAKPSQTSADLNTLAELLTQIRDENDKEQKYTRKLFYLMQASMGVMLLVILLLAAVIFTYIPKVNALLTKTDAIMNNLTVVTDELAAVDIEGTIDNINGLVNSSQGLVTDSQSLISDSQQQLSDTMNKISSIDFDGLNEAIGDLQRIISPLAKFFGR